MIKKLTSLLLGVLLFSGVSAQDNAAQRQHYLKVYRQALGYNDPNTAISALNNYLAEENSISYKDTLSILYYTIKSYYSALLLSEEVYKTAPDNVDAMARTAECYNELGDPKTAASLYEQVVPKTKKPYHFYKLAICQYQLKRTAECEASARAAKADTSSKRIGVVFTFSDGSQQTVPVNAAAANLIGVLKLDAKNYAGAKTDFEEALKLYPDFAGAKQNLDVCDRNLKGGTKAPGKTPAKPKG